MGLAWCALAALLAAWLVIAGLGDRVWWALPLLYGPRWLPAVLLVGMIPALLKKPRQAWLPMVLGMLVMVFGLLDFRLGLGRHSPAGRPVIRVMELNADGGVGNVPAIMAMVSAERPDVVVIAECSQKLQQAFRSRPEFHSHPAIYSLCLFSRGEILEWTERNPSDIWREGGAGNIVRAVVAGPAGPFRLGLVHLETPRGALQMYLDLSEIPKQGPSTRANMRQREKESRLAADWIAGGQAMPTIIAGDFNLPIESAIFRRYWGGYRDAFSQTGFGTGYTKYTQHIGARIDHILSSQEVLPIRSFVGKDVGSDHRPLIADLVLPGTTEPGAPGSR